MCVYVYLEILNVNICACVYINLRTVLKECHVLLFICHLDAALQPQLPSPCTSNVVDCQGFYFHTEMSL